MNIISVFLFSISICTSRASKIFIVSPKLKNKGAEITKDPFRKKSKLVNFFFLIIPKTLSSFPKWYEAIIKNIINVIKGKIIHKTTTNKDKKIYTK